MVWIDIFHLRFVMGKNTTSTEKAWGEMLERGRQYKRSLFEDGSLLSDEDLTKLGWSVSAILRARESGELLALPHPYDNGVFGYPKWQMGLTAYPNTLRIICAFLPYDAWAKNDFFTRPHGLLSGHSPYEIVLIANDIHTIERYTPPNWFRELLHQCHQDPIELIAHVACLEKDDL